jgi:hypothetical protein
MVDDDRWIKSVELKFEKKSIFKKDSSKDPRKFNLEIPNKDNIKIADGKKKPSHRIKSSWNFACIGICSILQAV